MPSFVDIDTPAVNDDETLAKDNFVLPLWRKQIVYEGSHAESDN